MSRKIKNKSLLLVFLTLFCSLFVPTYTVYAYFLDVISEDTGIELTLGSIDLDVKEESDNSDLTLKSTQDKLRLKEVIQNKGTLTGKLAYKIKLTKSDGNELDEKMKESLKIKINTTEVKIKNDYELLSNKSDEQIILNPNSSTDINIDVSATSLPEQTEKISLQIDFLLFQTNGTLKNPLFHDELTITYDITLDKKENEDGEVVIPPEEDPNDYWPTTGWIDNGNVLYNKEHYNPVMYFSEIAGTNNKQIKNLNDIIFYIEIKDESGLQLSDLSIESPEDMIIKVNHVNSNKQHLKVTISIDETKFNRTTLSMPLHSYSIASNNKSAFRLSRNEIPITLKRILLSADEAGIRNFNVRPVNLFAEDREIYLAQSDQDYYNYLEKSLSEMPFVKSSKISVEVSGDNKELVDVKVNQTEKNSFTLKPKSKTETKKTEMELRVYLEGTSGQVLEVKRNIQLLPTSSEAVWPRGMSTIWGTPDGKGNYGNKPNFGLKVVNNKFVSTNSSSIYVNNPYKEELQFAQSNSENFFNQTTVYSSSGGYMKVDLKFISDNLEQGVRPVGFSFIIFREKNINTSNPKHVDNTWVEIDYITSKETGKYNHNKMAVEGVSSNTEVNDIEQVIQAIINGEKELYIDYTQLPNDFNLLKLEEDIRKMLNIQGVKINFISEDIPELKAIKITVQE